MRRNVTRDTANRQQSAGPRWLFVGVELRAYCRCNSVGTDKNLPVSGAAIGEFQPDPVSVAGKSGGWGFEIDRRNADSVEQRAVQDRAEDADRILVQQR